MGRPPTSFPKPGGTEYVDLNLKTPFFLPQCLTPLLLKAVAKSSPKVINVASVDGISVALGKLARVQPARLSLILLIRLMAETRPYALS